MKPIRRHLTYANGVATLALLFAMSGGALAASHYLINSTKQINPKVLKKLKGNRGHTGTPGVAGTQGPTGPGGPKGLPGGRGTEGKEGPRGSSDVYEVELSAQTEATANQSKTLTLSSLPPGTYSIFARAAISPGEPKASPSRCELKAGSTEDLGFFELTTAGGGEELAVITTQVTHTFASTGQVTMTCVASLIPWNLKKPGTRILAFKIDNQHKTNAAAT